MVKIQNSLNQHHFAHTYLTTGRGNLIKIFKIIITTLFPPYGIPTYTLLQELFWIINICVCIVYVYCICVWQIGINYNYITSVVKYTLGILQLNRICNLKRNVIIQNIILFISSTYNHNIVTVYTDAILQGIIFLGFYYN